jgi:hypothetical protein
MSHTSHPDPTPRLRPTWQTDPIEMPAAQSPLLFTVPPCSLGRRIAFTIRTPGLNSPASLIRTSWTLAHFVIRTSPMRRGTAAFNRRVLVRIGPRPLSPCAGQDPLPHLTSALELSVASPCLGRERADVPRLSKREILHLEHLQNHCQM